MLEVEEKSVHSIATLLIACIGHEENNDYWNYHLHVYDMMDCFAKFIQRFFTIIDIKTHCMRGRLDHVIFKVMVGSLHA